MQKHVVAMLVSAVIASSGLQAHAALAFVYEQFDKTASLAVEALAACEGVETGEVTRAEAKAMGDRLNKEITNSGVFYSMSKRDAKLEEAFSALAKKTKPALTCLRSVN